MDDIARTDPVTSEPVVEPAHPEATVFDDLAAIGALLFGLDDQDIGLDNEDMPALKQAEGR